MGPDFNKIQKHFKPETQKRLLILPRPRLLADPWTGPSQLRTREMPHERYCDCDRPLTRNARKWVAPKANAQQQQKLPDSFNKTKTGRMQAYLKPLQSGERVTSKPAESRTAEPLRSRPKQRSKLINSQGSSESKTAFRQVCWAGTQRQSNQLGYKMWPARLKYT